MLKEYALDTEDEEIVNELDSLLGVVQNKETLKNYISYIKLKKNNQIAFGNYNIVLRNDSAYDIMNDFLSVCGKIFLKYGLVQNANICYLDKIINSRKDWALDKLVGIEDGIIVLNDRKMRLDYTKDHDDIKRIMQMFKDKIFIFEDSSWCEGFADAEIGELASWRMSIQSISLDDKIMYCQKMLDDNNIKYKKQDLKSFADNPFWKLKNMVMQLIIECKTKDVTTVTTDMLQKNKEKARIRNVKRRESKSEKNKQNAKQELDELIGLEEIKGQVEKILNYIKVNKERGKMPALHMCFTGNPGTGKTSIARIIGKLFDEENILHGDGEFVEIHGRDLIAKYVGWTADKVHETVEKAMGGVLFIDEAYSLISDRIGGYEDEAIATLIKEMEDHRDEICIILAGYTDEMKKLIEMNPGFESRIPFTIHFKDYDENELMQIFECMCKKEKIKLGKNCKELLIENFRIAKRNKHFGNGRYVRNLFEKIKFEQADRVIKKECKNRDLFVESDIKEGINNMHSINSNEKIKIGFAS